MSLQHPDPFTRAILTSRTVSEALRKLGKDVNGGATARWLHRECAARGLRRPEYRSGPQILVDELAVRTAVSEAATQSEVLTRLGVAHRKENYLSLADQARCFSLDLPELLLGELPMRRTSEFVLADLLVVDSPVSSPGYLKRRVLREGLLKNVCTLCANPGIWMGRSLTLAVDHVNGNSRDWRLANLRMLCPNCHTQTDTYAGRNIGGGARKDPRTGPASARRAEAARLRGRPSKFPDTQELVRLVLAHRSRAALLAAAGLTPTKKNYVRLEMLAAQAGVQLPALRADKRRLA